MPKDNPGRDESHLIATWGQARLLKNFDGVCKLVGGSTEDRAEAQKWVAMFMLRDRVEGLPNTPFSLEPG